jgi:tetratricopeptide (TPR) repeat protein
MLAPNDSLPKAKSAAQRAIELDPMLGEGHASLGYIQLWYDWDWPAAERSLKRALELNPAYAPARQWYSYYLETVDRLEESIGEIKRALELDPLSLRLRTTLASLLYFERQYDLVIEERSPGDGARVRARLFQSGARLFAEGNASAGDRRSQESVRAFG